MTLNEKLTTIQTKFKSKKSRFNSFGKYYFRSAEDILEAIKPFEKELGVYVTIGEQLLETNPFPIIETTATISDGKQTINATALVGVEQMPQRFGAASSYGKKYALGNLFLIDDTKDSDATNDHGKNDISGRQLAQAKDYIKAGGTVEAIKKKYKLTSSQEQELKTLNG